MSQPSINFRFSIVFAVGFAFLAFCVLLYGLSAHAQNGADATSTSPTFIVGEIIPSHPSPYMPGEQIGIAIPVSSSVSGKLTYTWTVNAGEIVTGQDTNGILYEVPVISGTHTISVTVTDAITSLAKAVTIEVHFPETKFGMSLFMPANKLQTNNRPVTYTLNGRNVGVAAHFRGGNEWGLYVLNLQDKELDKGHYKVVHRYKLMSGTARLGVFNNNDGVDIAFCDYNCMKADGQYHTEIAGYFDLHYTSTQQVSTYYAPSDPNALSVEWIYFERVPLTGTSLIISTKPSSFCGKAGDISQFPVQQCEALIALYNSTDGSNWITKTNWFETNTPCDWYGIGCLPDGSSVVTISLTSNNLTGQIPASLSVFSDTLKFLYLNNNKLGGPIPTQLGDLRQLEELFLDTNDLTGGIPPTLGNLKKLRMLHLGFNSQLGGEIPPELGNLPDLWWLHLGGSGLSGPIPTQFENLKNLQILHLSNNHLSGVIPDRLTTLPLGCLYLNDNDLTGMIPTSLINLTKLKEGGKCSSNPGLLDLSRNVLNATDPTLLEELQQTDPDWAQTQEYDLVGHWQFDECGGNIVNDASGLANHGWLEGGAVMAPARHGCALQFAQNGESMVITYTPSLEPVIGTIELWIKPDKLPETATDVLWKESFNPAANSNFAAYGLRIGADGAVHAYIVGVNSGNPSSPPGAIIAGSWHHLAIRWNGTEFALFVDGVLQGTSPYTPNPLMGVSYRILNTFHVGPITCCFNDQAGIWYEYFIGQIDDLRFYARALSDEEIQRDYQLYVAALTPNATITPTPVPSSTLTETLISTVPATQLPIASPVSGQATCPFYVYERWGSDQNHYVPKGWMGDLSDIEFDDNFQRDPDPKRPTVIRIAYKPSGTNGWAGIYWWDPPETKWANLDGGFDLSCATKLTFWARGEKGGEKAEFKVGGLKGAYEDSLLPASSTGPITLTNGWDQYTLALPSNSLTHIIGGFVWITNIDKQKGNPNGAIIYLDDIRFE